MLEQINRADIGFFILSEIPCGITTKMRVKFGKNVCKNLQNVRENQQKCQQRRIFHKCLRKTSKSLQNW
jgi:hypothetical protein